MKWLWSICHSMTWPLCTKWLGLLQKSNSISSNTHPNNPYNSSTNSLFSNNFSSQITTNFSSRRLCSRKWISTKISNLPFNNISNQFNSNFHNNNMWCNRYSKLKLLSSQFKNQFKQSHLKISSKILHNSSNTNPNSMFPNRRFLKVIAPISD